MLRSTSSTRDSRVEQLDAPPNFSIRTLHENKAEIKEEPNFSTLAKTSVVKKELKDRPVLPCFPGSNDAKIGSGKIGLMALYYGVASMLCRSATPSAGLGLGITSGGCCCLSCVWYACFYKKLGWCCDRADRHRMNRIKKASALTKASIVNK